MKKKERISKQSFGKCKRSRGIRKSKDGNTKGAVMTITRAKELLNAVIDHMLVAEKNRDVIEELLSIGFTENELITDFGFCDSDVVDVLEESEDMESQM